MNHQNLDELSPEDVLYDIENSGDEDFGKQPMRPDEANKDLTMEVSFWNGVTVHKHAMGGLEFRFGDYYLGHLHDPSGETAAADLELPIKFRNELVEAGIVRPHITDKQGKTGWITVPMRTVAEVAVAIRLFEYNYDRVAK